MTEDLEREIRTEIEESLNVHRMLSSITGEIARAAAIIIASYKSGGRMVIFGNGGSAADAQHIAGELVGRFRRERKAIDAIALTTNTSILTAIANDYSYEEIFARQVEANCSKNDTVIGISTSGRSRNVMRAFDTARKIGCRTIGLAGESGFPAGITDIDIKVPSKNTQRIQECHILIGHILSGLVEDALA
jgi:D-sedoheptulose 7-phosphate isomerase